MTGKSWDRVPIDAQSIDAPLSRAAVFLVLTVASGEAAPAQAASVLGGLDDLVKTVGFLRSPRPTVVHRRDWPRALGSS